MSKLTDFLVKNPVDNLTKEVVVSDRLKDHPFTIKGITGPSFAEYQKLSTVIGRHGKVEFNSRLFNELVILNHTVEPNFRDAEVIKAAGCSSPEQLMYRSLLAGEITELANQISALSGFDRDQDELIEDAKNS